jgi:hypothetical protein
MVCTPCQQKRDKLLQEARTKKTSIFFKGNADPVQIKIHGRIPIFCEAFKKWCVNAVYLQCDKQNCLIGTPKFDEILQAFDREQVEKQEKQEE